MNTTNNLTQAGWAQVDITPPLGIPMGGRGARFTQGASILDPLFAQATVIEDSSKNKVVFISLDLILLGSDLGERIALAVSTVTGAPPQNIVLNCSHTHSGPMTHFADAPCDLPKDPKLAEYENKLIVLIQRAAKEALNNIHPVTAFCKQGTSEVGINRRLPDRNGVAQMLPNPDGRCNKDLWVLELCGADDKAVLFSYGCHPVIVYSYCWDGISAEWPGLTRSKLVEKLGKQTHVQFLQALAGDIRPHAVADIENKKFIYPAAPGHVDRAAEDMANSVLDALDTKSEAFELELAGVSGYVVFACEARETETLEYWKDKVDDEDELTRNNARYWAYRYENGAAPRNYDSWPIGLIQLSPQHRLAWIAGEPLSGWLDILRKGLDDNLLWAIGYTKVSSGYLATDADLPLGGYEADRGRFGKGKLKAGVDDTMVKAFADLKKQLQAIA